MTVMSLSASLQHKTRATTDRVCYVVLNQTLSCKFKEWCKFSSRITEKLRKKRPACILGYRYSYYQLCTVLIKSSSTILPVLNTVELHRGSYGQMRKDVFCEQRGGNTLSWQYMKRIKTANVPLKQSAY